MLASDKFITEYALKYRRAAEKRLRCGNAYDQSAKRLGLTGTLRRRTGIDSNWTAELELFATVPSAIAGRGGAYTAAEFFEVAYWKTWRPVWCYVRNSPGQIEALTRIALLTANDLEPPGRATNQGYVAVCRALGEPDGLHGVGVPVASALLTLFDPNKFTVIDVRVIRTLWNAGELASYTEAKRPQRWWEQHYGLYVEACHSVRDRCRALGAVEIDLRTVDRALWAANGKTPAASTSLER